MHNPVYTTSRCYLFIQSFYSALHNVMVSKLYNKNDIVKFCHIRKNKIQNIFKTRIERKKRIIYCKIYIYKVGVPQRGRVTEMAAVLGVTQKQ